MGGARQYSGRVRRLVLLAGIWGWSFLFIKVAVKGMPPVAVACGRCGLGALVLLATLRSARIRLPRDLRTWRDMSVMGLVGSAIPFSLLAWAEQPGRISSALTSVLNASTPLFAAAFAAVLLRERLRPVQLGGLLLGLVGVGVAAGLGGRDLRSSSVAGELAAVSAAVCYGLSFAYAQRHLSGIEPITAATGQVLTAAIVLVLPTGVAVADRGISLTLTRVVALLLLGMVGTGVAYVLNYRSIAALGPTTASVVTYIVPVVAVAVGVVFLDEAFQFRLIAGGLLTVTGIALLSGRLVRRRVEPATVP
jgi:drug/metabolite transporter (DMT)-like permease